MNSALNSSYMRMLEPHYDLISSVASRYTSPTGRIRWAEAILAEPDLRDKLLVGDGGEHGKIKRLSNFWLRRKPGGKAKLKARRVAYQKAREAREATAATTAAVGMPATLSSLLDANRDELLKLAANFNRSGRVFWAAGLAENPDLADAIGYSGKPAREQRRILSVIGFWHRDRNRDGNWPRRERGSQPAPARIPVVMDPPPVQTQAPAPLPGPRFCPQCGHSLAAQAIAAGIVNALAASGLTHNQIIDTITRAAATVSRLTGTAKP